MSNGCRKVIVRWCSKCGQLKLEQFHFELLEGRSAHRMQVPRCTHHVVDFGGASLGRLHFVADLDVLDDISQRLKKRKVNGC